MKEKMEELRETLRCAYDMTNQVPARGEALDRLAAARQGIRNAHCLTEALLRELADSRPDEGGKKNG